MKRQIIRINEEKCNGCGICITACHEGALQIIDGKAKLISDSYCDGLGNCLPGCPTGAIEFEEREAAEFDEELINKRMEEMKKNDVSNLACGCPGTAAKSIQRNSEPQTTKSTNFTLESQLRQWPCQIKLVPINAPYFENSNLLVAADCTAYAYANFHNEFMKNKITIIGCPKLDEGNYSEKLSQILKFNNIKNVTVLRMEVPCCGGLEHAVKIALKNSDKMIPWNVVTISTDGEILD